MDPKKVTCESCEYYSCGHDGDYGSGPFWYECSYIMGIDDHPDFPFENPPGCYKPSFWLSRFAEALKKGTMREVAERGEEWEIAVEVNPPMTPPSEL